MDITCPGEISNFDVGLQILLRFSRPPPFKGISDIFPCFVSIFVLMLLGTITRPFRFSNIRHLRSGTFVAAAHWLNWQPGCRNAPDSVIGYIGGGRSYRTKHKMSILFTGWHFAFELKIFWLDYCCQWYKYLKLTRILNVSWRIGANVIF